MVVAASQFCSLEKRFNIPTDPRNPSGTPDGGQFKPHRSFLSTFMKLKRTQKGTVEDMVGFSPCHGRVDVALLDDVDSAS